LHEVADLVITDQAVMNRVWGDVAVGKLNRTQLALKLQNTHVIGKFEV
jgi:hypothetical protein